MPPKGKGKCYDGTANAVVLGMKTCIILEDKKRKTDEFCLTQAVQKNRKLFVLKAFMQKIHHL